MLAGIGFGLQFLSRGISNRIEVEYETDMWICNVLDSSRDADHAVHRGSVDSATGDRDTFDLWL